MAPPPASFVRTTASPHHRFTNTGPATSSRPHAAITQARTGNTMKKTLILSCALALAGPSNVAFAAEGAAAFVRAELGQSNADVSLLDDTDTAYNLRGGYFFNKHFAVEGFVGSLYDNDDVSLT